MTKGRSTTWQERIDIVQYCLAHQHDYRKTADPASLPMGEEV
ncbi:transposase IS3/IS911 family protein [Paenibacillus thiaminolyticus]|nr:transposase IS3/IS911 family protein [Paenibacillus thiaminolyticus]